MRVFLSWSGERSRAVAEAFSTWIQCVLQASKPWISSKDLDRGSLWFTEISDQLKDVTIGVIFITQENKDRPWILFEAGALAKGLSTSRVCTFLVDLQPADIQDPLAQFNHTLCNKDSIYSLTRTLNNCFDQSLDERILAQVFETYWPQFESKFAEVLSENPLREKAKPRPQSDIISDVLDLSRNINARLNILELNIASQQSSARNIKSDEISEEAKMKVEIRNMVRNGIDDNVIKKMYLERGFSSDAISSNLRVSKAIMASRDRMIVKSNTK